MPTPSLSRCLADYGDFLTVAEAAAVLRIGRSACYGYVQDGILQAVRMGHRVVVPKAAIERMTEPKEMNSCPTPGN